MKIEVKYEGLRAIEENLRMLREQFGVRTGGIIIRALRVGAKLIRDEARRRAPFGDTVRTVGGRGRRKKVNLFGVKANLYSVGRRREVAGGLLRKNIIEHAIPTDSSRAGGKPTVLVRVRNSGYFRLGGKLRFNRPGSSPGYWWLVEFGTAKMPARSFMRSAFEAKKHEAMQAAIGHMRKEIDEFFKQHLKKAA